MTSVLLVTNDKASLSLVAEMLNKNNIKTDWSDSGAAALAMVSDKKFDLVITDEKLSDMTGRKLVEKIITIDAMLNCIAISSLSSDDFHEEFEGLGVLMQLPKKPDKKDAEKLIEYLNKVLNLTGN